MGVPGDSWQPRFIYPSCLFSPFSVLQGCHQQRPFLRDACRTEKEGLVHKETLSVHQGTAAPRAGAFLPPALGGRSEPSRRAEGSSASSCPLLKTSFSFCSFLSGRRVGSEGWGCRRPPQAAAALRSALWQQQSSAAVPGLSSQAHGTAELSLYLAVFLAKGLHLCSTHACEDVLYGLRRTEERKRSHALERFIFVFVKQT